MLPVGSMCPHSLPVIKGSVVLGSTKKWVACKKAKNVLTLDHVLHLLSLPSSILDPKVLKD